MNSKKKFLPEIIVSGIFTVAALTFGAFLSMRLLGVIDWSWWIITMPVWLTILLFLSAIGVMTLIFMGTLSEESKKGGRV